MDTTIAKGMSLIEYLADCDEPKNLQEIVAALGYSKSNVHRLLKTFQQLGYVSQEGPRGRYTVTIRLWELGVKMIAQLDMPQLARPHLVRLSEETGETALLAIRDGLEVIYMDRIINEQPIGIFNRIGRRAPAWCNATGRVILAHQHADVATFAAHLVAFTPHTIHTIEGLEQELGRVRDAGYAVTLGEWHDGVYGLAAPIFDAQGTIAGSVGITGTVAHYQTHLSEGWHRKVMATAREISRELGMPRSDG